jgi:putative ABC transport system permease protein
MSGCLRLYNRFILRALAREKTRSAITILGISLGVGVMLAIRLANTTSLGAFKLAAESIAGETSVQIAGTTGRFDEMELAELGWLRDYGIVSPVVEGFAMTLSPPRRGATDQHPQGSPPGEFIRIVGIDVLRDLGLRRYRLVRLGSESVNPTPREFVSLLTDPNAIILTEKFARRRGLSIGDTISLSVGGEARRFTLRGLLLDEGPARALDGRIAVMDIAAAQVALDRLGMLDRLDVKLRDGISIEAAKSEIGSRLPAGLVVAQPDEKYGQVEKMIAAFHFNLSALGSIALLVGLFLIYNTVSISVIARREEIGTLRALGLSRRAVLGLFLGEAALLAGAGTIAGLVIGRLLAAAAVRATATTVETFYIASTATDSISSYRVGPGDILTAFAVALPLSLLAASMPALEASGVRPLEAMRGATRLAKSFRPSVRHLMIAAGFLLLALAMSVPGPVRGLPIFGYGAALALMFGGAFLTPFALWVVSAATGALVPRLMRRRTAESKLATANLRGSIPRIAISVAALGVSLAMMTAISILIGSFRETVGYWIDQTLKADIYAKSVTRTTTTSEGEVPRESLDLLRSDPDVAAIDTFTALSATYNGSLITVGGGDFQVLLDHGRLAYKSPSDAVERVRQAIDQDVVVVSESFSLLFRKQPGDMVELPTRTGSHKFEVAAVYYDYSNNRGVAVMDRNTFGRYYPDLQPSSLSIYLRPGVDPERAAERLSETLGSRFQLQFTTNGSVRREVVRIFDSTFTITYALEAIAIIVAALGVISTLITLIIERRRELAILSFIGATRAQLRRVIVGEALLIGGVSQVIGVFIGLMLSLVLIYVINVQSFGWTIQFHLPWKFLVLSTVLLLAVTAAAALYPATSVVRMKVANVAREE